MQSDYKQIYKELGEPSGTEEVYKDIGTFIFSETSKILKNPTCLIIKLKGVGAWHLRRKRMQIVVDEWSGRGDIPIRENFDSEAGFLLSKDKHEQYNMFVERLRDYDKYLLIKKEVREKRNETQTLMEDNSRED